MLLVKVDNIEIFQIKNKDVSEQLEQWNKEGKIYFLSTREDYRRMNHEFMVMLYNKYSYEKVEKFKNRDVAIKMFKELFDGQVFEDWSDEEMTKKKETKKAVKKETKKAVKKETKKAVKKEKPKAGKLDTSKGKGKVGRKRKHPLITDKMKISLAKEVNFRQESARGIIARNIDKKGSKVATVVKNSMKGGLTEEAVRKGIYLMVASGIVSIKE